MFTDPQPKAKRKTQAEGSEKRAEPDWSRSGAKSFKKKESGWKVRAEEANREVVQKKQVTRNNIKTIG